MTIPTKPGFYWYRDADYLACVKIELEAGELVGYATGADDGAPLDEASGHWPGKWLGEAVPPLL